MFEMRTPFGIFLFLWYLRRKKFEFCGQSKQPIGPEANQQAHRVGSQARGPTETGQSLRVHPLPWT
jgi:hypothetical protein